MTRRITLKWNYAALMYTIQWLAISLAMWKLCLLVDMETVLFCFTRYITQENAETHFF
jgi:hypothetical protein